MIAATDNSTEVYNQVAAQYDALLAGDLWIRSAFQQRVLETVSPGSLLLDFGCGTGTDARFYVQQGYRVLAYDNAPGMMARLREQSAEEIAAGSIVPHCGDYASFRAWLADQPPPQAIVSDFAVLNHILELRSLFADLATSLAEPGWILASVLNPFHWQEGRNPAYWRPFFRSLWTGYVSDPKNRPPLFRHHVRRIVRAAQPHFRYVGQASAGFLLRRPVTVCWHEPHTFTERMERRLWSAFPFRSSGPFLYLTLRRRT